LINQPVTPLSSLAEKVMEIDPDVVLEGPLNSWMTGFSLAETEDSTPHADKMINKERTKPFTEIRAPEYPGHFRSFMSILRLLRSA